jgi:hypothetical protein
MRARALSSIRNSDARSAYTLSSFGQPAFILARIAANSGESVMMRHRVLWALSTRVATEAA